MLLSALPASTSLLPFESKFLPAVLLFLRIYFPQITVTVTVLKFGWISFTVTVLASAVTPSFPLIPNYRLESHLINFPKITVTVTVLKCFFPCSEAAGEDFSDVAGSAWRADDIPPELWKQYIQEDRHSRSSGREKLSRRDYITPPPAPHFSEKN